MGRFSDRYKSKYGRRRPFVFIGAFAVALTFLSIWMVPQNMGETGTFLWLTIGSVLFFTAFTVYSVPTMLLYMNKLLIITSERA